MKKYYEIENLEMKFETIGDAKFFLKNQLYNDINYMYSVNKKNAYRIVEVEVLKEDEEDSNNNEYKYTEVFPEITVKEFSNLSAEEKDELFEKEF